jgi:hypothetical protein
MDPVRGAEITQGVGEPVRIEEDLLAQGYRRGSVIDADDQ